MKIMQNKRSLNLTKVKTKKLKWGVAGCGNFLENSFLPIFQLLPKNRLVSVYSSNLSRAEEIAKKFFAEKAYNNFDEFLQSDIEAVYISSANVYHFDQILKAARAGKHILCEKPLVLNSKQAKEVIKVCEENQVMLVINYVHRFHPLSVKVKELIEKGLIGKIVSISASFNIDLPPTSNFRFKRELSGGGALWDLGTHMIDVLRFFGGEITDIKGFIDNVIYKSEVEDFANAVVKFEKSGYGHFNVSFNSKKSFNRVEILGYNGAICIENLIGKKGGTAKLTIDLVGEARKSFRKRANKQYFLLKNVYRAFLKNEPLPVSAYDGLVNIQIMEKLEQNVNQG